MTTMELTDAPSAQQLGWIRQLLFERGIEHAPDEVAPTATEASAFIKACLNDQIGTVQPATDEQLAQIAQLEAELGPRPDGEKRELPTDRAGASRYLRALGQVRFARANDAMLNRLRELGVEVDHNDPGANADDVPFAA